MMRKIGLFSATLFVLALMVGTSMATVVYLGDGATQNSYGGWDLPAQGTCPADTNKLTRPDCVALRLVAASSAACQTANGGWTTAGWTTGGVCNDLVNNTQALCNAQPDRFWNSASNTPPGTDTCSIIMKGDDRNNVVCAAHGGTWVTTATCIGVWRMPDSSTYTPPLLTGTTNPGPGDQCLRCHNGVTQYNGPRVRDTDETLFMGHKNMSRKVTVGTPWGGPPFHCTVGSYTNEDACYENGGWWVPNAPYPSDDSGNAINWTTGQITISGTPRDMTWIYGDWLAPLPRVISKLPAATTKVCSIPTYTTQTTCESNGGVWIFNAGASYSCGRCHTTGWTSDAAIGASTGALAKEPEKSFPGITWDRNTDAGFGVVNLTGGVTGDANKYSSWDSWGVSCTRCHSSAVNVPASDSVPPFSSPTGMSSHHSNITAPDNNNGVCSDFRFTNEAVCTSNGGQWITACSSSPTTPICTINNIADQTACTTAGGTWTNAPFCSNTFYNSSQSNCTANGFTWTAGWCRGADPTGTTCVSGSTYRGNGSQASCQVAANTWSFSSCSVEGLCNKGVNVTTKAACDALTGQFAYATDIIRCIDAGGKWTGNNKNRGQIITSLCMGCHRQETGGLPFDGGTDPGGKVTVAPYHETITFPSHPHGNQFLNSPHGKYTGTSAQIATARYGTGYGSYFQFEGEAAGTGNGCTGCHDPHQSTVEGSGTEAIHEECQECHNKNLNKMLSRHPGGVGTPLEHMTDDPAKACEACHMPGEVHMFRINTDASYSTFPSAVYGAYADATACTTAGGKLYAGGTCYFNANTAPDGTYAPAVWVDIDMACGQCHGGGAAYKTTKGSITAGSKALTVTSATNITTGQRIKIAGAGALGADFESYVSSVAGSVVTLVGKAATTVTNANVTQNPTKNGAGYINKTTLAGLAEGMHNDAPVVSFYYQRDPVNTLLVNVNAAATTCNATCNVYDWSWGDGTPNGSGVATTHTYAAPGTYAITLTVTEYGVGTSSKTQNVNVYAADLPPVIGGSTDCNTLWNVNNWTAQINDASTDDHGIFIVRVTWGDGSLTQTGPAGTTFNHTYTGPGSFTITRKVYDTIMQEATQTCTATLTRFSVNGTVQNSLNVPVPSATLKLVGTGYSKTLLSSATGTFAFANLKPGVYTLTITKTGYVFPAIPAITVGPNSTAIYHSTTP